MDASTLQVLQDLKPGSDAQFFSDAMAIQIGKSGLTIAALLAGVTSFYYALCTIGLMGSAKRGVFALVAFLLGGAGAYMLYEKAQALHAIDDSKPVLAISGQKLDYDVRRNGWSIPWSNITSIELKTTTTFKKQSVEQTSYEIHVNVRSNAPITWKYEPSTENDIAATKLLAEKSNYLVIDPEPLGISPPELQKALEKYRAGL